MPSARLAFLVSVAALAAVILHGAGNSTFGYVDSPSLWRWWVAQWLSPHAEMQHGPVVVLGAAWLGWRRAQRTSGSPDPRGALRWLWAGWLLHVVGFWIQMPRLSALAAGLLVLAWAAAAGGRAGVRAWAPAVLLAMLSLSWGFVDTLGLGVALREAVAWCVQAGASLVGVALNRQGTQLLPPGGGEPFEVAAACAGLRSLSALVALGWFVAFSGPLGWGRRVGLGVAALVLVVVGNLVRVGFTVAWALRTGTPLSDHAHEWIGMAVFAGEAVVLFELAHRWRSQGQVDFSETTGGSTPADIPTLALGADGKRPTSWVWALLPTLLAAGVLAAMRGQERPPGVDLPPLPEWLDASWSGQSAPLAPAELGVLPADTQFARRIYEPLGRPSGAVMATVLQAGRDRTSFHRPELCLAGLGWRVTQRSRFEEPGSGLQATLLHLRREDGREGLMIYWYAKEGRCVPSYSALLRAWLGDLVRRDLGQPWRYWAVQTLVGPEGAEAARQRSAALIQSLWQPSPVDSAVQSRKKD